MEDRRGPDNIIHLDVGPDGRLTRKIEAPAAKAAAPTKTGSPVKGVYSVADVARMFGYTPSRLRNWVRIGLLEPSAQIGGRRYFTFRDLISVRTAKGLLDAGVPVREVRRSVESLRRALPDGTQPLSDLRVIADGNAVVVEDREGVYEALTGQRVLDFRVDGLRTEVVRMLEVHHDPGAHHPKAGERRAAAYESYLLGCKLDEDETTYQEAEQAYRKALSLDPTLTSALTNLGNLFYRQDDLVEAERHYRLALALDPDQPEALYNLGFLHFERGEIEAAVERFEGAVRSDPSFADAHFNLAMAYEESGRPELARPRWRTYLALEPSGSWAAIAEEHLRREGP